MVRFEWDHAKPAANLRERGFDFEFATLIFDGPMFEVEDRRKDYGERRMVAMGHRRPNSSDDRLHGPAEQYSKAEPLLKRALAIIEEARGPYHSDVAVVLENYPYFFVRQNAYRKRKNSKSEPCRFGRNSSHA
jgi:hypothetical protein